MLASTTGSVPVLARGQSQLDLAQGALSVRPPHLEQAWRLAAQDFATRVSLELKRSAVAMRSSVMSTGAG